jgi:hypothetical protein
MELLDRAALLRGPTRERIIALSEVDEMLFQLHPYFYCASQLSQTPSQPSEHDECPESRQSCENRMLSHLLRVVRDAVRVGDLEMPESWEPEDLAFSFGVLFRELRQKKAGALTGDLVRINASRRGMDLLLNALEWRPFTWEWNYERTRERSIRLLLHGLKPEFQPTK